MTMRSCCSSTRLLLAPDYHAHALRLRARAPRPAQARAGPRADLDGCWPIDPHNRAYRITHATACVGVGKHEQAIDEYREILAETPRAADMHLSVAHALKTLGKQSEAVASYRTAFELRPSFGDAYWSLANLKTYRFPDEDIARMREQERAPDIGGEDRYHLCFALGKALEDRGEYAESFGYYRRGNALKKAEMRFKIEPIERNAPAAGGRLHARVLRGPARLRVRFGRPDLHRRPAARRLDAARADSRLSLAGRRHDRAAEHSALRGRVAGTRSGYPGTALSCHPRAADRRGFHAGSARSTSPIPASIAPASRDSSTRCRTISGTSGSFT